MDSVFLKMTTKELYDCIFLKLTKLMIKNMKYFWTSLPEIKTSLELSKFPRFNMTFCIHKSKFMQERLNNIIVYFLIEYQLPAELILNTHKCFEL